MDRKREEELMRQIRAENDPARKMEILEGAIEEANQAGATLRFDQIEALCEFATKAVKVALEELLEAAKTAGTEWVPNVFIEMQRDRQPTAVAVLMATIDRLNIKVDYGQVPDDLSELEAL